MDGQAELEALQRMREEKLDKIAEKRKQVEELRRRRAEKDAEKPDVSGMNMIQAKMAEATAKEKVVEEELGRSVDSLIAEILSGNCAAAAGKKASAEKPLQELKKYAEEKVSEPCAADRALTFQQELSVASQSVEPQYKTQYDRAVQTDSSSGEPKKLESTTSPVPVNILVKMADQARNRQPADAVLEASSIWKGKKKGARSQGKDEPQVQKLNAEQRDKVEKTSDFQAFFERTTLLVERTLGKQTWDFAVDLTGEIESDVVSTEPLKYIDDYLETRWASGRAVTDVRFSPHHSDMFLASYGRKANPSLEDPPGCLLVWNAAMKSRPELAFTCPSGVLSAHFHRFEPALFFGGTYSGGIVLWDARAKAQPVMRSPPNEKGHSHPVQAMQQVGTENSTNLITASNDGRLCVWSTAMLSAPQDSIDLKYENKTRRDVSVMSLSFPENETNTLYVGAEDGSVCQVHIHGARVGVTETFDGHEGPVSAVHVHPCGRGLGEVGAGDSMLALTSSFDWSVKLWSVKQHHHPVLSLDACEDYILDVKWHPLHPAVFAAVDGDGHVDLWNLNQGVESPAMRTENPNQKRLALNHCDWSSDGRKLVTGDSEGTLSIYAADRSLANPRGEDIVAFQDRVRSLQPIVPRPSSHDQRDRASSRH